MTKRTDQEAAIEVCKILGVGIQGENIVRQALEQSRQEGRSEGGQYLEIEAREKWAQFFAAVWLAGEAGHGRTRTEDGARLADDMLKCWRKRWDPSR